jgi:hypothetical protein
LLEHQKFLIADFRLPIADWKNRVLKESLATCCQSAIYNWQSAITRVATAMATDLC